MLKKTVAEGAKGRIVIMDSITKLSKDDEGQIVLSASHGGASSGEFALAVPLRLVLFNDAGVGKNRAGVSSLDSLGGRGIACAMIGHETAMIGDAQDMWDHGILTHVNAQAAALGLAPGQSAKDGLTALID